MLIMGVFCLYYHLLLVCFFTKEYTRTECYVKATYGFIRHEKLGTILLQVLLCVQDE